MSSLTTMQAPCSLVNCGLNEKPSALKNACERFMSRMGRLTKILRAIFCFSLLFERAELAEPLRAADALLLEVFHLVERPHLDLGRPSLAHRVGKAAGPLQRLLAAAHLDQGIAGDQLLALGERSVDHARTAATFPADAEALAGGLQ